MAKTSLSKVKIKAETSGFDKATKDINRVDKAQQRTTRSTQNLGKASAATGRQFAAQASGLGGFVAAYAGAAANIFAVQQAFSALARAAQVETTIRGTRTLAAEIGQSGDTIIAKLQEVTQGQLTVAEAAQNANIALSAGFNVEQIERLTSVATKASKALGRNLTESLQRVFRGAIKLEPELLDEIGIFTRIDPAVQKYANSLNRSVSSLTEFERRQAFANAVAEEGERKFSDIDITSRSAQKSLEQLASRFIDLATKIGITLANVIEPFVSFLAQNFGNTLLLVGAIGTQVFKGFGQQVAQFTSTAVTQIQRAADATEAWAMGLSGTAGAFAKNVSRAQKVAAGGFAGAGAFAGRRDIAQAATQAKQAIAAGDVRSVAQAKEYRTALQAQIESERNFIKEVESGTKKVADKDKAVANANRRIKAATVSTKALAAAEVQAGLASRGLAKGAQAAAAAVTFLGNAVSKALAFFNIFFVVVSAVQLVFSAFGVDVIGGLIEWFTGLTEATKKTQQGFKGLSVAAADLNDIKLAALGFESVEVFADQASSSLQSFVDAAKLARLEAESTAIQMVGGQTITGTELGLDPNITPLQLAEESLRLLNNEREKLIKDGDRFSEEFIENAQQIAVVESNIKTLTDGTYKYAQALAYVEKATGLSTSVLARQIDNLKEQNRFFTENGNVIEFAGAKIGELDGEQAKLTETGLSLAAALFTSSNLQQKLNEDFNEGNISSEQAAKALIGQKNALDIINKELEKFKDYPSFIRNQIPEVRALDAAYAMLTGSVEEASDKVERLVQSENFLKTVRGAFSSQIKAVDEAVQSGSLSINGVIAASAEERQRNLSDLAQFAVAKLKEIEQIPINERTAEQNRYYDAGKAALKAQAGILLGFPEKLKKINDEEDKRIRKLNQQILLATMQSDLIKLQQDLQDLKNIEKLLQVETERANNISKQNELLALQEAAANRVLQSEKQALEIANRRADLQEKLASAQLERGFGRERAQEAANLAAAQAELDRATSQTGRVSREEEYSMRKRLLDLQLQYAVAEIDRRSVIAAKEFNNKMAALDRQEAIIRAELDIIKDRRLALSDQATREYQLLLVRQDLENQQRTNQLAQINKQIDILDQQLRIDIQREEFRKQEEMMQLGIIKEKYKLLELEKNLAVEILKKEQELLKNEFEARGVKFDEITFKGLADLDISGPLDRIKQAEQAVQALSDQNIQNIVDQNNIRKSALNAEKTAFEDISRLLTRRQELERQIQLEGSAAAMNELADNERNLRGKLEGIGIERQIEQEKFMTVIEGLDAERKAEVLLHGEKLKQLAEQFNLYQDLGNAIKDSIASNLKSSINDFYTAVKDGTLTMKSFKKGVGDLFINILDGIQQAFIDKLIVDKITKMIDTFVQGIVDGFTNAMMNSQSGSSGLGGMIGSWIGGLFAPAAAGSAASTVGSAATGSSVVSLPLAAGGAVHKASGGNILRDRVPALLEPGEFVIRKPAAKAIGGSALNQLNATGSMSNTPTKVDVNMNNQGTAQEVQEATVRNDMDKLIIDIVVKDLENNGQVKRAMRR